jgi:uncharacterized protein YbjT (DUF2867 family)
MAAGWEVRGGSRSPERRELLAAAGIEAAAVDPARLDTVLEQVGDVAVVAWLMGSATGEDVAELHGGRLRRLLERLVDTPVRGFLYEGAGGAGDLHLAEGAAIVEAAGARFRIPAAVTRTAPDDPDAWLSETVAAVARLL